MSETSQALNNLRALAIVMVVSFHSLLAYLATQPSVSEPFWQPPYHWIGIPILDHERWFGFDLFSAFNYMTLMPLMFLLSGLFLLPSLTRRGGGSFMHGRLVRLGLPLVFGLLFLMPLAYYPVYRLSSSHPSIAGFRSDWLALPVWPSGPLWFLEALLTFNLIAGAVYLVVPGSAELFARISTISAASGIRSFVVFLVFAAASYIPLAFVFGPWNWLYFGPLGVQPDRVLLYGVFFFAGVVIGARGLQNRLLGKDGSLARFWHVWLCAAAASFLLWAICMAPLRQGQGGFLLCLLAYFTVALLVTCACLCYISFFLRFATGRSVAFDSLSKNAYGIYVVHYVFVVWLQYLMLDTSLPALAKGTTVFIGTLILSWAVAVAWQHLTLWSAWTIKTAYTSPWRSHAGRTGLTVGGEASKTSVQALGAEMAPYATGEQSVGYILGQRAPEKRTKRMPTHLPSRADG